MLDQIDVQGLLEQFLCNTTERKPSFGVLQNFLTQIRLLCNKKLALTQFQL